MKAKNFIYDGVSSDDMGVMICSFDGGDEISTVGSKVEISTAKSPNSYKWLKTNAVYNEQLTFSFSFCKDICNLDGNEMSISSEEQAEIIRWLVRKENHYLSFEEDGFENIYYNCTISLEKKQVGGSTIGFTAHNGQLSVQLTGISVDEYFSLPVN